MSRLSDIRSRVGSVFVTGKTAGLLGVAVPVVMFLPPVWAWLVAAVWAVVVFVVVRRDIARSPGVDQLVFERITPTKMSIGVANKVTLAVRNSSALTARLVGRETPPVGFVGKRSFGPVTVHPRSSADVVLSFTPPSRGSYDFGDVGVRSIGPLGLAGRQMTFALAEKVKVYPDITAVYGYSLLARKGSLHEIGMRSARFAGMGTEFESLRDYLPGDDYRDIDWKATARGGRPIVRQFEVERSQTIVLAIDAGRLMNARVAAGLTKLDRSVNAALLLAYLATQAGDNVALFVFGRDVRTYLPPRKGHRQFLAILEALYTVDGRVEEPDYAGALRYLAMRLSKRSLIVLFTELVGTEPSGRLLSVLSSMSPRHLPLVITQRNPAIEQLALSVPETESAAFGAAVVTDILQDKAAALRMLEMHGSLVLDVLPEKLSVAAVNRYLEIKARGRL